MNIQTTLGDLEVTVAFKRIKNMYLRVLPPHGGVQISAPLNTNTKRIRAFVLSKQVWIKKQQEKLAAQPIRSTQAYVNGEEHLLWGAQYRLELIETHQSPVIDLHDKQLRLYIRPGTDLDTRRKIVEKWYRQQVDEAARPFLAKWEPVMNVKVKRIFVRRMKTLWGSCNYKKASIRLNTELAKRPLESLEYIVVHEMAHLLEPSHNKRFYSLMDAFLPSWKRLRKELNAFPISSI